MLFGGKNIGWLYTYWGVKKLLDGKKMDGYSDYFGGKNIGWLYNLLGVKNRLHHC